MQCLKKWSKDRRAGCNGSLEERSTVRKSYKRFESLFCERTCCAQFTRKTLFCQTVCVSERLVACVFSVFKVVHLFLVKEFTAEVSKA